MLALVPWASALQIHDGLVVSCVTSSHVVNLCGGNLVSWTWHCTCGGRVVVLDVMAVRPAVVVIFKDMKRVPVLILISVVLVDLDLV